MRRLKLGVAVFLVFGMMLFIVPAKAQSTSSVASPVHTGPMPDQRFYSLIFRHVLYLQANGGSAGSMSPSIARFYTDRIGATSTENATLLAEARAWKAEVDPLDAQAHAIVVAIRAKTPGGHLAPGQQPPAAPQQLYDLQTQRTPSPSSTLPT